MGRGALWGLAVLALLIASACGGSSPQATSTTVAPVAVVPGPDAPPLGRLYWMSGIWRGNYRGARVEEHWTAPEGGMMIGMHRDLFPDDDAAFEFLRIVEDGESLIYLASPNGEAPTEFRMVEQGERSVVFENPEHDFPRRILYRREGETLVARVEGQADGKPLEIEWRWTRAPETGH